MDEQGETGAQKGANMSNIDDKLRNYRQMTPKSELPANFTAQIVSEINKHPARSLSNRLPKEDKTMKKFNLASSLIIAILIVGVIGGATYAAINQFNLLDLWNQPPNKQQTSSEDMKAVYLKYYEDKKSNNSNALSNLQPRLTSELSAKLNSQNGLDPVLCAQNLPLSITFQDDDGLGSMTAVNHFEDSEIRVSLVYDRNSGVFTDISCLDKPTGSASANMQSYYEQYVAEVRADYANQTNTAKEKFLTHTTESLASDILNTNFYDPIVCAQNTPLMVEFDDIQKSSMVAVVHFASSNHRVQLEFDPVTEKFTSITCPIPSL